MRTNGVSSISTIIICGGQNTSCDSLKLQKLYSKFV